MSDPTEIALDRATPITQTISTRVRQLRDKRGLTQQQLADAADLHRTYVGQIEGGGRNISVEALANLACALDVSPESLIREVQS